MAGKLKVAVATKGSKGLKDEVSPVFGRAKTFTVVEVEDGKIKGAKVVDNPASSYEHGAGPIATKMLVDKDVDVVVAAEFGAGVSTILKDKNIRAVKVKAGTNVCAAVDSVIKQ